MFGGRGLVYHTDHVHINHFLFYAEIDVLKTLHHFPREADCI